MAIGLGNGKNGSGQGQKPDDLLPRHTAVTPPAGAPWPLPPELTQSCPYFGSPEDPATRFLFASPAGTCHRAEPPAAIALSHQQACCLTAQHTVCPVYQQSQAGPLPVDLRPRAGNGRSRFRKFVGATVGLLLVLALVMAAWVYLRPGSTRPLLAPSAIVLAAAATATPTPVPTSTSLPASPAVGVFPPTALPATVTMTPSPTVTPAPTATASPTAVPSPTLPATFTPAPTAKPTVPPTAVPLVFVDVPTLNVRQGPGTDYPIVAAIEQGGQYEVMGRSFNGDWWQLCCFIGEPGWVIGDAVTVTGDTANVPVVRVAPAEPVSDQ